MFLAKLTKNRYIKKYRLVRNFIKKINTKNGKDLGVKQENVYIMNILRKYNGGDWKNL